MRGCAHTNTHPRACTHSHPQYIELMMRPMFNDSNRHSYFFFWADHIPIHFSSTCAYCSVCAERCLMHCRHSRLNMVRSNSNPCAWGGLRKNNGSIVQAQFNKANNIISVVVYNNVKTCDRKIFPDGTIKQPTVDTHYITGTWVEKENEKRRTWVRERERGRERPRSPYTNEMALWSTVRHKYHWICSHSHSRHILVRTHQTTAHFRFVSFQAGKRREKSRHIKKVSFSTIALCRSFMGSFSLVLL